MKTLAAFFGLLALAPVAAPAWELDPTASFVSYVSAKDGSIAEVNTFTRLSGAVVDETEAIVRIDLASIESGIDIRNERLRDFLFKVADFPVLTVTGEILFDELTALEPGASTRMELALGLETYGGAAAYDAQVLVTRAGEDRVVVSSVEPVIVYATDLGFEQGLARLQDLAGLESILPVVPVFFVLSFVR